MGKTHNDLVREIIANWPKQVGTLEYQRRFHEELTLGDIDVMRWLVEGTEVYRVTDRPIQQNSHKRIIVRWELENAILEESEV